VLILMTVGFGRCSPAPADPSGQGVVGKASQGEPQTVCVSLQFDVERLVYTEADL
jgi:hypothetical protein